MRGHHFSLAHALATDLTGKGVERGLIDTLRTQLVVVFASFCCVMDHNNNIVRPASDPLWLALYRHAHQVRGRHDARFFHDPHRDGRFNQ